MSTYYNPIYKFKIVDYNSNYSNPPSHIAKYLYIEVYDQNRDCDEQNMSYFLSLKDLYLFKNGLLITIGNKTKEINLRHYELNQADLNYQILLNLFNICIK
jgi:hypothetical protein